ncbi:hypothetical protein ACP70R_004030 [Stipagrostis hirtigluma subsp. patula]
MAFWTGIGQVATVAQLTGVDACGLVSMILEAVRTVRRNKEECNLLARRVAMIGDLLQMVRSWDMMQNSVIRKSLHGLDDTLREAYGLITSCRDSSNMYSFFMGRKQAEQFRDMHKKIDGYLKLYPIISHIDLTNQLNQLRNSMHPSSSRTLPTVRSRDAAGTHSDQLRGSAHPSSPQTHDVSSGDAASAQPSSSPSEVSSDDDVLTEEEKKQLEAALKMDFPDGAGEDQSLSFAGPRHSCFEPRERGIPIEDMSISGNGESQHDKKGWFGNWGKRSA